MESSKKRRRVSACLWGIFIIMAAGAGLFLFYVPNSTVLAQKVAESFTKTTGTACSITGPANVSFFPAPAVTLYHVRLGPPIETPESGMDSDAGVAVEIPAIQIRLSYLPLLKGEIVPAEIKIHDPLVNINALTELFSTLELSKTKNPSEEEKASTRSL